MSRLVVTRSVHAPIDVVFNTVADITEFSKALPHIVKVEFLSDTRKGVGTRFRETRVMNGREVSNELEVTEYVQNDRVRIVSDSHGTIWDSLFTVRPEDGNTTLTMTMDASAYKLIPRFMNFAIRGMVRRAVENDLDMVRAFCEK
jgi:carbon monoxide dehydrogenase subunit G